MTDEPYVELHASSAFSFLAAASAPESIAERAAELEMPALAIADRNGVYGAARFHTAAKRCGVKAHIGAEIAVSSFGRRLQPASWLPHTEQNEPARITLLCASQAGYQNLCQLITRFKMREATKTEGAATLDDLAEFSAGLICLTGGDEGPLAAALAEGRTDQARKAAERLVAIYGRGNIFVELQRHQLRDEESRNQALLTMAASLQMPIVATNGVRAATEQDREVLDVLTAIRHHVPLDRAGRLLAANNTRALRSSASMSGIFRDLPEAIANTQLISQRLQFTLDNLGYQFPHYPVPDGETMDSFLAKRVDEGVRKRYSVADKLTLLTKARAQVQHELALITKLGFAGYFLIVWDIVRYCQRKGFLVQGRGSAANSVVCYALEITANVISYRGRSTAREVGKALGFQEEQIERISSLIGHWEWKGANDTLENRFAQAGFDLRHPRIAHYLDICKRMKNLPRHLGQHSGGMVICAGMLNRVVPIERASMPGRSVIQWDKEDCADLGLIKVDLLGLGMMAVLKETIELIPQHYNTKVDLAALPEDPRVYDALCKADTVGMFQVESRAQMASIPHNAPRRFYDIVVLVAIIRPGPIAGKMMHPYMRRRQGKEEVTYPHPSLEPVLKRTLGVPLFQEQLLRMSMAIANFSGAEADELRRAVGMRRSMERMKNLEGRLRAGMTRNGISPEAQDNIVQSISSFAMYGFPESHAASFALIAYASAYLKVHFLAAFTCALLNNQPMGFYSPAVLIKDAQRHGLRVLPIDVQRSLAICSLEHEEDRSISLRIGFNYARGMRSSMIQALLDERTQHGGFQSADDLTLRVPTLNSRDLTILARIGALNTIDTVAHRRDALWQVEKAGRPVGPLLRGIAEREQDTMPLAAMTTDERLSADYSGIGLTTGPHPFAYQRSSLRAMGCRTAADLVHCAQNAMVHIAGCVIARQRPGTAKGFVFLSLEDETGIANIILTPDLFERERLTVTHHRFLHIHGLLQNNDGVVHVKAKTIAPFQMTEVTISSHDFH
ncbi:DNA polymerase III subunit alpha [Telmatobacter bradus]|uniref:DNA polymerase III subunit alpha n=1 Tax=Telmatobacter bradus TaxID=474953 RepID=UPI003B430DF5